MGYIDKIVLGGQLQLFNKIVVSEIGAVVGITIGD